MGLAINIGFLADMKQHDSEGYDWAKETFDRVSQFLESNGQATWEEDEGLDHPVMRDHVGSFPYSFLHYLRRAYAHALSYPDEPLEPTDDEGLTGEDEHLIGDASSMMSSHLLCHSDAEGLYVPVDFPEPLFDFDDMGVPGGGMLGSSHGLLRELRTTAPPLGIELDAAGNLGDEEAERLFEIGLENSHPFSREYIVFLALWENARASVEHHTAIVFS